MDDPVFGGVDLTNCDREPIHIPGSIQPYGLLLALDPGSLKVVQHAGDARAVLGVEAASLLHQSLDARLGPAALSGLKTLLAGGLVSPRPFFVFEISLAERRFDVSAHFSGGLVILEFEPAGPSASETAIELVQRMVGQIHQAQGVSQILDALAQQVQAVTGYDRVMVYRFKEDDSGHVVAESRSKPDVDSFLDLHYPASDIPVQARALYRNNWIRCIPDVSYRPALLEPPLNPQDGQPLDLSFSFLRAVSPLHLEYLSNMGVRASMSLSLVVGGKLWGLVACHHGQTGYLSHRVRAACELFAQLASLQLQSQLEIEHSAQGMRGRDISGRLIQAMSRDGLVHGLLRHQPDLTDLIPSAGVALCTDGEIATQGTTPEAGQIRALCEWLLLSNTDGVFASDRLAEVYPGAAALGECAAGVLALSVTRDPQDFVLWFRPEQVKTVRWAGNPAKPVAPGLNGDRLTPRKSFEAWAETVRGRSEPWTPQEIEAATRLRVAILEVVLRRLDAAAHEYERTTRQQDLLMAELDHRVKNTLATIQALVRISGRSADSLEGYARSLEKRIQAMSQAHSLLTSSRWEGASVRSLVEEELSAHLTPEQAATCAVGPDIAVEPKAAISLSLGLHELATNAVKYGALSVPEGRVSVEWRRVREKGREWLSVRWVERGGPSVAPPTRSGFGRTLLERIFAPDVGGEVTLQFDPEGVVCELSVPYARVVHLEPVQPTKALDISLAQSGVSLAGVKVLVVEDGVLVAEDVAQILKDAGATVVGPFHSLESATAALPTADFDLALLDVDLDGKPVWPLASLISQRGHPYVLATGFSASLPRPSGFETAATIAKPYDTRLLLAAIAAAQRGPAVS